MMLADDFAPLIQSLKEMGSLADENTAAFQRMGAEIDAFIAEALATLQPSERIVYWFLMTVRLRYPLDTLALLDELREHSPEPML